MIKTEELKAAVLINRAVSAAIVALGMHWANQQLMAQNNPALQYYQEDFEKLLEIFSIGANDVMNFIKEENCRFVE